MKRPIIAAGVIFLIVQSGAYLIVDRPEESHVIVVLGGDRYDVRYWRGMELLHAGYGHQMVLDAGAELNAPCLSAQTLLNRQSVCSPAAQKF